MFTLHRLLMGSAGIVVIAAALLLSGGPTMAGSSAYQGIRYSGGHRSGRSGVIRHHRGNGSSAYHFFRPRFARYNSWYPWRRDYYDNRYSNYPNYGNRYLRDVYRNQDYALSEDAELLSDAVATADSDTRLGWLLLANGEVHSAVKTFSIQTRKDPNNSILKVGYALAVAETGELHEGVSVMRGALRSDPDSLHYLMLDEDLQGIVKNLIHRYEDDSSYTSLATAARNFMVASLYYLLGDAESAGLILPVQDTDSSTRNLDRLIQQMRLNG
jgi:tetratricopeptide (TPR) repeat protein